MSELTKAAKATYRRNARLARYRKIISDGKRKAIAYMGNAELAEAARQSMIEARSER